MKPARSIFAALLVTALSCVSGCRSSQRHDGLTTVKLQADWYPQPEQGGFFDAVAKGFYKDEGLDVQIVPGGPYITGESLVASGVVQFGMNSSDHVIESIANSNEPLIAVGATMQHDPQGLILRASSPVHTWTDLNGHTVAVKPGSTWWEFLVSKFHLDRVHEIPATYSVANFLQDPDYIQQAFVTSEPYFAQRAGVPTRMLMNSDAGYDPYRVFYTSTDFLREHPDTVARFVRASLRGWRDYMNDPTAANAMILKLNPALSPDWMQYSYNALKKGNYVTGDDGSGALVGQFDSSRWQSMYAQLLALHVLKRSIEVNSAFTTKFLN